MNRIELLPAIDVTGGRAVRLSCGVVDDRSWADPAEVARSFGGGGHPRAAGATLTGDLAGYLETIPKLLEDHYAEWAPAD